METEKNTCLFPNCGGERAGRGLCKNHYNTASRIVRSKKTSWEKLEKAGKSLPHKKRGEGNVSVWFLESE